jgi:hypothetical protein
MEVPAQRKRWRSTVDLLGRRKKSGELKTTAQHFSAPLLNYFFGKKTSSLRNGTTLSRFTMSEGVGPSLIRAKTKVENNGKANPRNEEL